jgi:cytochrome c oxidase subunit 2
MCCIILFNLEFPIILKAVIQRTLTWLLRSLPVLGCFLLEGCSRVTHQSTLDPKGPLAAMQYDVFMVSVYVSLFLFVTVGGTLLWVVIHYRERESDAKKPLPEFDHGNPLIEIGLIVVSVVLLVIIAVPTVEGIFQMNDLPKDEQSKLGNWYAGEISPEEKENVLEVTVTGYQWWWRFEYPQLGLVTANELAIPVGKVVKLNLRGHDVIHSFWLPKIAGKVDLIPGRANWMWIQGDEVGHYYGQCAEFCGDAHAYMLFRTNVLSNEDFAKWIAHQKQNAVASTDAKALKGKELFATATCIQCHTIRGNATAMGVKGPDLTHVASRASLAAGILDNTNVHGEIDPEKQRENMFNWVRHSEKIKPGNKMYYDIGGLKDVKLTDEQVHDIVAYLQTLK